MLPGGTVLSEATKGLTCLRGRGRPGWEDVAQRVERGERLEAGAQAKGEGRRLQLVVARLPKADTEQGQGQSHGRRDWETAALARLEGKAESERGRESACL